MDRDLERELAEIMRFVLPPSEAPSSLSALSIGVDRAGRWLRIRAHFDHLPSRDDIKAIQIAGTEAIAQWAFDDWKIDEDWEIISPGQEPDALPDGIVLRRGDPDPPPVVWKET